jgi:hypothetical protein
VLGLIVAVSVPHTAVVGFELAIVAVIHPPVEGCYSDLGLWCSWICFCSKSLLGWIMSDLVRVAFLVFCSKGSFMLAVFCHMGLLICEFFCACVDSFVIPTVANSHSTCVFFYSGFEFVHGFAR